MYRSTAKNMITAERTSPQKISILITLNELKYPAKHILEGAAKMVNVGTAGSGSDLITNTR
jgi:hypothetical protein